MQGLYLTEDKIVISDSVRDDFNPTYTNNLHLHYKFKEAI